MTFFIGGCSGDGPVEQYAPLSAECDACLRDVDDGCGTEYDMCLDATGCEQLVTCELRAACYGEPADSGCSADRGCTLGEGADATAEDAAEAFESCARSGCRQMCHYAP